MKKILFGLLFLVLMLPSVFALTKPGYFDMHDDLQVMRIYELEKCFADGQIPCRWSPDMNFDYGQPMFNFYSVTPYYLGYLIRTILPISIVNTVKILFAIALLTSGVGMYLLTREFWGKAGGLLASLLFLYAPYHAVDVYIRGALAESFALAVLPFLWLALYKLVKKPTITNIFLASFAITLMLITHNITAMIIAPFTAIWVIFWIIYEKKFKSLVHLLVSGILGIGMASFFLVPALAEQVFIRGDLFRSDYYNYAAHFISLFQLLFSRVWGNGPSVFGDHDQLSFQIGWPLWWLVIPTLFVVISWFKRRSNKKEILLVGLVTLFAVVAAFLTHQRSLPIWELVQPLAFVQFPWRFLGLVIFFISILSGALIYSIRSRRLSILVFLTISLLIAVFNFGYFRPMHYLTEVGDEQILSGEEYIHQKSSAPLDYLSVNVADLPHSLAPNVPQLIDGSARFENYSKTSNTFFFDVYADKESTLSVPVIYYPGWNVVVNNSITPVKIVDGRGLISIVVGPGKSMVKGRFEETPLRSLADGISVVSLSLVIVLVAYDQRSRKHKINKVISKV